MRVGEKFMDSIEQEFFEAFGIEPSKHFFCGKHLPRYKCVCWDRARQRNSYCKDWDYKNKKCEFYTEDIERRYYPSITPEIVLGLFDILLYGWEVKIRKPQVKDGFWYRIFLFKESEVIWFKTTLKPTLQDAIMDLLIQLQPEIQNQVKELFNGK